MNALAIFNQQSMDEERQTEEMLEELNRQASQNREYAEIKMKMRRRSAQMHARKRMLSRKWTAVKQVCFCTLCTAALYGFEQIGLPNIIALPGMLTLGAFAIAIAVEELVGDIRFWRIKKKVNKK